MFLEIMNREFSIALVNIAVWPQGMVFLSPIQVIQRIVFEQ